MKAFVMFGYRFSVERFKRYSVQIGFDPERGYKEMGRFDSLRVATEFLRDECNEEASFNLSHDVYGIVVDRLTFPHCSSGVRWRFYTKGADMKQKAEVVRLSVQLPLAIWESLEQIKKGGGGSISSQIAEILSLHEATLAQLAEAFRALGQTQRIVAIDREKLVGSLARLEVAAAPLVEEATRRRAIRASSI